MVVGAQAHLTLPAEVLDERSVSLQFPHRIGLGKKHIVRFVSVRVSFLFVQHEIYRFCGTGVYSALACVLVYHGTVSGGLHVDLCAPSWHRKRVNFQTAMCSCLSSPTWAGGTGKSCAD